MATVWAFLAIIAVLLLICMLALVDQYRTLALIRARLEMDDSPEPLDWPTSADVRPSNIGLPERLDNESHLVLLFLSTRCNTCRKVIDGFKGRPPATVWVVLETESSEAGGAWLSDASYPRERATLDLDGSVAASLDLDVTPAAFLMRYGEVLMGQTIPSYRQLSGLLSKDSSRILQLSAREEMQS
jgi:hypothetical protein